MAHNQKVVGSNPTPATKMASVSPPNPTPATKMASVSPPRSGAILVLGVSNAPTLQRSAIPKQGIITSRWLRPVFSSPLHPRDPPPLTRPSHAHSSKTEQLPPHFSTPWAKLSCFPHHITPSSRQKSTLTPPTPAPPPAIDKSQKHDTPPFDKNPKHFPSKTRAPTSPSYPRKP